MSESKYLSKPVIEHNGNKYELLFEDLSELSKILDQAASSRAHACCTEDGEICIINGQIYVRR